MLFYNLNPIPQLNPVLTVLMIIILSIHSQHRDLGIIFSANLNWSSHYEAIISKAYKSFGLLRRVFCNTVAGSIQAKKGLYISIVRSNLLYCSPLWRPYFIKDITLLERVQHRAMKYILGDYTSDYKTRLIKLNLLPLMYIYELLDILFFIKSLRFNSPNNSFNISHYITFNNASMRSGGKKLIHSYFIKQPYITNSFL